MLVHEHRELKIKSREQLTAGGFNFQCFCYAHLRERFNTTRKVTGLEQYQMETEIKPWTNDELVIATVHKFLLRFEMEEHLK